MFRDVLSVAQISCKINTNVFPFVFILQDISICILVGLINVYVGFLRKSFLYLIFLADLVFSIYLLPHSD